MRVIHHEAEIHSVTDQSNFKFLASNIIAYSDCYIMRPLVVPKYFMLCMASLRLCETGMDWDVF